MSEPLTASEVKQIEDCSRKMFKENRHRFVQLAGMAQDRACGTPVSKKLIHTIKYRVKEPSHLLDKLTRKAIIVKTDGALFEITANNLFEKIGDLVGLRNPSFTHGTDG